MAEMSSEATLLLPEPTTPAANKHCSQSIKELCQRLAELSPSKSRGKLTPEERTIVYVLKSKRLRSAGDAHAFRESDGLTLLLQLVTSCREEDGKDLVLLLGTLANLCALEAESRSFVMANGFTDSVHILKKHTSSDVLNNCVRLLANLALDSGNIAHIHEQSAVKQLCHVMSGDTISAGCRQSILRAVRIICSGNTDCREELKSHDGMQAVVKCFTSDASSLSLAALQTLEALSSDGDPDIIQPLCSGNGMGTVVKYCSHSKPAVTKSAINLLLYSAKSSEGRIALSSAGGVEMLVTLMTSCSSARPVFQEVVRATCMCCRDVLSRQKLRDCGGLEQLIKMISQVEYASLHGSMISALVCYYFDENTLKFMVKRLGLLKALAYHLKRMTDKPAPVEQGPTEEEEEEAAGMEKDSDFAMNVVAIRDAELIDDDDDSDSGITGIQSLMEDDNHSPRTESPRFRGSTPVEPEAKPTEIEEDRPIITTPLLPQEQDSDRLVDSFSCLIPPLLEELEDAPPAKRPRLQLDIVPSAPLPANFLDSLLSSPSPYKKAEKIDPPHFAGFEMGPPLEAQILLLLSRVSHLRDCLTCLAAVDMLQVIFDYFASHKSPPNVHVFKVLTRIFLNPHCFQDCLVALISSRLYTLVHLPDTTPASSLSPVAKTAELSSGCDSGVVLSPGTLELPVFVKMCHELLDRLSKVAESPYGQGVLAHMLLRGEEKEKQASSLAIPILSRSPRICQRMMLSYKGLEVLTSLFGSEGQLQTMAVESLLALAQSMVRQRNPKRRRHSYPMDYSCEAQPPPSKAPRLDSTFRHLSIAGEEAAAVCCLSDAPEAAVSAVASAHSTGAAVSYCKYKDSDHCPFDLVFVVNDPHSDEILRLPVHKAVLTESSDVFSVMLTGEYRESSHSEVSIHDVPPLAFKSIVHHIYGCGWQCRHITTELLQQQEEERSNPRTSSTTSETEASRLSCLASQLLIEEIVSTTAEECERLRAKNCLQVLATAGRFLLSGLTTTCEHAAASHLSPANVVAMFHFARLHQFLCLSESCVRSIVDLPHSQLRTSIFHELLTSTEGYAALEIVQLFLLLSDS